MTKTQKPIPIIPIPENALPMDYKIEGRLPDHQYPYYNAEGKKVCIIGRWNNPDGTKKIHPISYCKFPNGKYGWKGCGLPAPRPLYNLHLITSDPTKPILFVEGERTADAASKLFPEYIVTTTMYGAQSPHFTDFTPLNGRNVVINPDHDEPGKGYANRVYELLCQVAAETIKYLSPEKMGLFIIQNSLCVKRDAVPEKYDLADALEEGWTAEDIKKAMEEDADFFVPYPTSQKVQLSKENSSEEYSYIYKTETTKNGYECQTKAFRISTSGIE